MSPPLPLPLPLFLPLPLPCPSLPAMFQPGLQIDTNAHLTKLAPPTTKRQSSSLTPKMEGLLKEYEIIDGDSDARGLPRKVSPAQEGGQTGSGKGSPKLQGSQSQMSMSTSQGGGAEKVATPTSTQSSTIFSWAGAKEDARAVVQVWFGFEDGNLVAVTASSCLQLYQLSTSPRKEVVKVRGRPWFLTTYTVPVSDVCVCQCPFTSLLAPLWPLTLLPRK